MRSNHEYCSGRILLKIFQLLAFLMFTGLGQVSFSASTFKDQCFSSLRCENDNSESPIWAKLLVGADLAERILEQEVRKRGLQGQSYYRSKIAVVDTGFSSDFENLLDVNGIKQKKGHDRAGDPRVDLEGHGTAVMGFIGGKGFGFAPRNSVTSYRLTSKYELGSASQNSVNQSIIKACEDGHDIVNVSWGSSLDDDGDPNMHHDKWYKKANELGCLVIRSSGNSAAKSGERGKAGALNSPFLPVGAVDAFMRETLFTSFADIYAPGASVLTFDVNRRRGRNTCSYQNNDLSPINGTSFSGPMVAAMAGQIHTMLKLRGLLPEKAKHKFQLIKGILLSTALYSKEVLGLRYPVLNAYAAMLVAKNINKTQAFSFFNEESPDLKQLWGLFQKTAKQTCQKDGLVDRNRCSAISTNACRGGSACVESAREKLLLCSPSDLDWNQLQANLVPVANSSFARSLLSRAGITNRLAKDALEKFWAKNRVLHREFTKGKQKVRIYRVEKPNEAINLLLSAVRTPGFSPIRGEHLLEVFRHPSLYNYFSFNHRSNHKQTAGRSSVFLSKFLEVYQAMEVSEQLKLLESVPRVRYNQIGKTSDKLLYDFNEDQAVLLDYLLLNLEKLKIESQKVLLERVQFVTKLLLNGQIRIKDTSKVVIRFIHLLGPFMTKQFSGSGRKLAIYLKKEIENQKSNRQVRIFFAQALGLAESIPESIRESYVLETLKSVQGGDSRESLNVSVAVVFMDQYLHNKDSKSSIRREALNVLVRRPQQLIYPTWPSKKDPARITESILRNNFRELLDSLGRPESIKDLYDRNFVGNIQTLISHSDAKVVEDQNGKLKFTEAFPTNWKNLKKEFKENYFEVAIAFAQNIGKWSSFVSSADSQIQEFRQRSSAQRKAIGTKDPRWSEIIRSTRESIQQTRDLKTVYKKLLREGVGFLRSFCSTTQNRFSKKEKNESKEVLYPLYRDRKKLEKVLGRSLSLAIAEVVESTGN